MDSFRFPAPAPAIKIKKIKTIQIPLIEDDWIKVNNLKKKLKAKNWRDMFDKILEKEKW